MADIVITKSNKRLNIDLGVHSSEIGESKMNGHIVNFDVNMSKNNDFINLFNGKSIEIQLKHSSSTSNIGYIVDTVAGVAPTSTSDLYDKLIAILEDV